ncbi:MAG: hypothetical protein AB6733_00130 [Clostridiaceae bacterium]
MLQVGDKITFTHSDKDPGLTTDRSRPIRRVTGMVVFINPHYFTLQYENHGVLSYKESFKFTDNRIRVEGDSSGFLDRRNFAALQRRMVFE